METTELMALRAKVKEILEVLELADNESRKLLNSLILNDDSPNGAIQDVMFHLRFHIGSAKMDLLEAEELWRM